MDYIDIEVSITEEVSANVDLDAVLGAMTNKQKEVFLWELLESMDGNTVEKVLADYEFYPVKEATE